MKQVGNVKIFFEEKWLLLLKFVVKEIYGDYDEFGDEVVDVEEDMVIYQVGYFWSFEDICGYYYE